MERGRSGGVFRASHEKHPHIYHSPCKVTKNLLFSMGILVVYAGNVNRFCVECFRRDDLDITGFPG